MSHNPKGVTTLIWSDSIRLICQCIFRAIGRGLKYWNPSSLSVIFSTLWISQQLWSKFDAKNWRSCAASRQLWRLARQSHATESHPGSQISRSRKRIALRFPLFPKFHSVASWFPALAICEWSSFSPFPLQSAECIMSIWLHKHNIQNTKSNGHASIRARHNKRKITESAPRCNAWDLWNNAWENLKKNHFRNWRRIR